MPPAPISVITFADGLVINVTTLLNRRGPGLTFVLATIHGNQGTRRPMCGKLRSRRTRAARGAFFVRETQPS